MERYYLKVQGQQGPVVAHDTLEEAYIFGWNAARLCFAGHRNHRAYGGTAALQAK